MKKDEYFKAGFHFTWGAMCCVGVIMWGGIAVGLAFHSKDDCDGSWWDRCGMKVVMDHKTGKEYLLSPYGGIIERPRQ